MGQIIEYRRSVVPSCDVKKLTDLKRLVEQTHDVEYIGGYKVGSILAIRYGLPQIVQTIRRITDIPIIYDHQKAMTDINDLGKDFVAVVKESGVDALIGFPQAGPVTEEAWIKACQDVELEVIIGGEMTHPKYKRSEGGYIADEKLDDLYLLGSKLGVNNFVVPGNKVERVVHYKKLLSSIKSLTFFAPGFISQGGKITEVAQAISDISWHAIIGRALYEAKDVKSAAKELTSQF
jgi:orotidine-5'-phosphate decarboxylase